MPFPLGIRPIRMYFSALEPASPGHCSGISIESPQAQKGAFLFSLTANNGVPVAFNISETPVLDVGLAIVTPTSLSNFDAIAAPTVIIRQGRVLNLTPTPPEWFLGNNNSAVERRTGGERADIFIPAGATLTIMKVDLNRALFVSAGVEEQ